MGFVMLHLPKDECTGLICYWKWGKVSFLLTYMCVCPSQFWPFKLEAPIKFLSAFVLIRGVWANIAFNCEFINTHTHNWHRNGSIHLFIDVSFQHLSHLHQITKCMPSRCESAVDSDRQKNRNRPVYYKKTWWQNKKIGHSLERFLLYSSEIRRMNEVHFSLVGKSYK